MSIFETIDDAELFDDLPIKDEKYKKNFDRALDLKLKKAIKRTSVGDVIIVGAKLGGGKSLLVLKLLATYSPALAALSFIFLSMNHRNSDGLIRLAEDIWKDWKKAGIDIDVLKGKSHYCQKENYVKASEKYGIELSLFCKTCDFKDHQCEFWFKYNEFLQTSKSFRGVHAFLGNIVDVMFERAKYTDLVIDENPKSTIFQRCAFTEETITKFAVYAMKTMKGKCGKKVYDLLAKILDTMQLLYAYRTDKKKFNEKIKELYDKVKYDDSLSLETCSVIEGAINDIVEKITSNIKTKEDFPRHLNVFKVLSMVIEKLINKGESAEFFQYSFEHSKKCIYIHYCDLDMIRKPNARIWILDGTTSTAFWRQIYGQGRIPNENVIDDVSIVRNKFLVLQLSDGKYGMNTLTKFNKETRKWFITDEFIELYDLLKKYIIKNDGKRILIISRKAQGIQRLLYENLMVDFPDKKIHINDKSVNNEVASEITEEMMDKYDICLDYFGVSRGTNIYKDFDRAVIFGGAFPNRERVKRESIISGIDSNVLTKCETEDEMNQSWARIRPKDDKKEVLILSDVELGFVNHFKTFKMTVKELNDYFDGKPLVSSEKVDFLKKNKTIIDHVLLGTPYDEKLEGLYSFNTHLDATIKSIRKDVDHILRVVKRNKEGIDVDDISTTIDFDAKMMIDALVKLKEVHVKYYKPSMSSRKMKERVFSTKKLLDAFDEFPFHCSNTPFDGETIDDLHKKLLYILRYKMKGSGSTTAILKKLKVDGSNEKNRSNMEKILDEMVRRKILTKMIKGKGWIYNFVVEG